MTPKTQSGSARSVEFNAKIKRLTATLREQFKESAKLEKAILSNLRGMGYGE